MSYISQRFSPHAKPAGDGLPQSLRNVLFDLSAIVLVCVVFLASVPAFAEQIEDADADVQANSPVLEADRPIRDYIIWPLIFVDEAEAWRQFSFVPFYVERKSSDDSDKRVHVLWPIYMYRRSGKDVSIRVVPFFTYWKDYFTYAGNREHDLHYMLFPIIFGSESPENGKSFALFPIGGKMRNFLGRDEIAFVLFPLYLEYTRGELRQRNYLWPVLSFSEGGGYNGFRLWPLYGYFEQQDKYRRQFALWPIYSHQTFDLDKEQSGERTMVFRLFAREDSARRRYRSILWPFFGHEENFARNFEEYSAPWPFIIITRGDVHQTRLWPLYGYKRADDEEMWSLLWPFWRRREFAIAQDEHVREVRLNPIVYYETITSDSGEIIKHRERVWPLWRFRRYKDGSTRFKMLSLLWFSDERGFERQYSPLWTIYDRAEQPDGDCQTRALWGLIQHDRSGAQSETRVPLLFSRVADAENGVEEARILGGLIASVREGEMRKLRLFRFGSLQNAE